MNARPGRTIAASTVGRRMRRILNEHAGTLTEKVLARALSGDVQALVAATALLVAANGLPSVPRAPASKTKEQ